MRIYTAAADLYCLYDLTAAPECLFIFIYPRNKKNNVYIKDNPTYFYVTSTYFPNIPALSALISATLLGRQ